MLKILVFCRRLPGLSGGDFVQLVRQHIEPLNYDSARSFDSAYEGLRKRTYILQDIDEGSLLDGSSNDLVIENIYSDEQSFGAAVRQHMNGQNLTKIYGEVSQYADISPFCFFGSR